MILSGTYTKEEVAAQLGGIDATKASNITRKLNTLNYKYTTSGKGKNYRITIINQNFTLKTFAKEYLNLNIMDEEKLKYFLHFILTQKPKYLNMSFRSMEWYTPLNRKTISDWIKAFINVGLLIEKSGETIYYKTKKIKFYENDMDHYTYYRHYKEATEEQWNASYEDFMNSYSEYLHDETMPPQQAAYLANIDKITKADGWFIGRKKDCDKLEVNEQWEHFELLNQLIGDKTNFQLEKIRKFGSNTEDLIKIKEAYNKWEADRKKLILNLKGAWDNGQDEFTFDDSGDDFIFKWK